MNTEQLEAKQKELTGELEKAETELGRLRPQLQYLEAMQQRLSGALQVLQDLMQQERQSVVTAQPVPSNSQVPIQAGA